MAKSQELRKGLHAIFAQYQASFTQKAYKEENDDLDLLMAIFSLTPELKRENRQYWGRELGMCWQRIVTKICEQKCDDFGPALRVNADEPCDFIVVFY